MTKLGYFGTYGGLNAIAKSRFFYGAMLLTAVCGWYFTSVGWWDLVISVIPGLVGFSIAGVAIFVSLGSDSLRSVIAGREPDSTDQSPFIDFMAMFTHFIVVQLVALVVALLAKAFYTSAVPIESIRVVADPLRGPFWLLGGLCFWYAVLLCVALAREIYRLAEMIDDFETDEKKPLD